MGEQVKNTTTFNTIVILKIHMYVHSTLGTCFQKDRLVGKKGPDDLLLIPCKSQKGWAWWYTSLIIALRKQKQADISEFKISLVYIKSSRPVGTT